MSPALSDRAGQYLRALVPTSLALVLLLATAVPLGLPYLGAVGPLLSMCAIYYWSIYRPELMPAPAVFAVGLVHDALTGGPPGLMALTLLLVHGVCVSQRRALYGMTFLVGWFGFAVIAMGAHFFAWAIAAAYYFTPHGALASIMQGLVTVLCYPPVAWMLGLIDVRLWRPA